MNSYKTSIFLIKILSFFIPIKSCRKEFRVFLNQKLKVDYNKNLMAQSYLKKYTHILKQESLNIRVSPSDLPIWQLWFQGGEAAPVIVKRCLDSVQKYTKDRKIIILTQSNIYEYVDIPQYILDKKAQGIISNTHFSDILRICLLEKYGGTWIDATVLLTGKIPIEILEQNFFAFSVPENHPNYKFHLFSSWFMHAQPGHAFLKSFKKSLFEYWKYENSLIDYFTLHLIIYNIIHSDIDFISEWRKGLNIDNISAHEMQLGLKKMYSEENIQNYKLRSMVHKLTYKIENDIEGTLLDKIIKDGL